MKTRGWILLETRSGWGVGRVESGQPILGEPLESGETPQATADSIARQLESSGYSGEGLVLGLASEKCQAARVGLHAGRRQRDRTALSYALEVQFPIAAEDLVADFIFDEHGALGVATQCSGVSPLIESLENHGVAVDHLTSWALLAAQAASEQLADRSYDTLVWSNAGRFEVFFFHKGKLQQWVLASDIDVLLRTLRFAALGQDGDIRLVAYDVNNEAVASVASLPEVEVVQVSQQQSLMLVAVAASAQLLAGEISAWVELRRGPLAAADSHRAVRTPIRFASAMALLLLVSLSAALLWRAGRYERLAEDAYLKQRTVFQEAFPGQPVPVGIRSRLETENLKIAGLTGYQANQPDLHPPLATLRNALAALPTDLRFRLVTVRVDRQGRVHLEGEVKKHGDAGRLAGALRSAGLQVEQPRSEQLPEGYIGFRIDGVVQKLAQPREAS